MATAKKSVSQIRYEVRLVVYGDSAKQLKKIIEEKKKADRRKTDSNTVEAIILEYSEIKK